MVTKSTVNLDYPPGATPLDAEELASLIPSHLTTQAELNEWEQLNIVEGDKWARKQRKVILTESFLRQLHQQMCATKLSTALFRRMKSPLASITAWWPSIRFRTAMGVTPE